MKNGRYYSEETVELQNSLEGVASEELRTVSKGRFHPSH